MSVSPSLFAGTKRGRLWIAENYTYSDGKERFDLNLRDRIIILEDTDHDGKFDKRTVFTDEVQMLTSIERGFGGVYAMCPPNLLFIPMDGDKPAGPAQVVLDGFSTTVASRHTFANGLKWGRMVGSTAASASQALRGSTSRACPRKNVRQRPAAFGVLTP